MIWMIFEAEFANPHDENNKVWVSFFDIVDVGIPIDSESGDDMELTGQCRFRRHSHHVWTYGQLDETLKLEEA